jgi:uncharacterized repeat protein (TIGR03803 family)
MKTKTISAFFVFSIIPFLQISGQCPELWGTSTSGYQYQAGTIFSADLQGNLLSSFEIPTENEGINPTGSPVEAGNGKLYGMTSQGGTHSNGIIYEWDPINNVYMKKYDLDDSAGSNPSLLSLGVDENLFGLTSTGGKYNLGVLFEWNPETNVLKKIVDFNGVPGGSNPVGKLIQTSTGRFFGLTNKGGLNDLGSLYEWNPVTEQFNKRFDFNGTIGSYPIASLVEGKDGLLYGIASKGGASDRGTLFSYSPLDDTVILRYSFKYDNNYQGCYPKSIISGSDGKIYGTTETGGKNYWEGGHGSGGHFGVLFQWDLDSNTYNTMHDLLYGRGSYITSLVEINQFLYGFGFSYTEAKILKYNLQSRESYYISINDIVQSPVKTTHNKLYVIAHTISYLCEFSTEDSTVIRKVRLNRPINGKNPVGPLLNFENGSLYGVTSSGGTNGYGVIYEWNMLSGTFKKLFDFNGTDNGKNPTGLLVKTSSGKIIGTTQYGGINDKGILFEWDPQSNQFKKITDFGSGIESPHQIVPFTDNRLFLIDTYNQGCIYELDVTNYNIKTVRQGSVSQPIEKLEFYNNTGYGISDNYVNPFIFSWVPDSNSYRIERNLPSGYYKKPVLIQDGVFYIAGYGSGYEYDAHSNHLSSIFALPFYSESYTRCLDGKFYTISDGKYAKWDPDNKETLQIPIHVNGGANPLTEILNNEITDTISVTSCEPYQIGNYTYRRPGLYRLCLTDKMGLDSVVNVNLTIKKRTYSSITEYVCGKEWTSPSGKYTMKDPGSSFTDTIPNYQGCDSIISITRISENQRHSYNIMACDYYDSPSGKYKWTTPGGHYDTIPAPNGCLDFLLINLVLGHTTYTTIDTVVCDKYQSVTGEIREESGTYYDTVSNYSGCYNIITTQLTVNHKSFGQSSITGCDSVVSPSGRHVWKYSGSFMDTIPSSCGCDSLLLIDALVHKSSRETHSIKVCDSMVSPSGKYLWTESGIYSDTLTSTSGCDSILTFDLDVHNCIYHSVDALGCESYSIPGGHYKWLSDGIYNDTISGFNSPDTIIIVNLDIININPSVVTFGSSLQAAASGAQYQWVQFDNDEYTEIEGATSQSYTPRYSGNYAVIISKQGCADTSQIFPVIITEIKNEVSKNEIILYPNPTNGKVTIDLGKVYSEVTVTILNSTGMTVQELKIKNAQEGELHLNGPGMYLVKVRTGDGEIVHRVIRQ